MRAKFVNEYFIQPDEDYPEGSPEAIRHDAAIKKILDQRNKEYEEIKRKGPSRPPDENYER